MKKQYRYIYITILSLAPHRRSSALHRYLSQQQSTPALNAAQAKCELVLQAVAR